MRLGLEGRAALVTGGSKGIGRAVAVALAAEGVAVSICARGKDGLDDAAREIAAAGGTVFTVQADVTQPDQVERLVSETAARFGRLDILVNNAVASNQGTLADLSDDEWRHHIDVKLMGYVRTARAAVPHMKRNGYGRIVNMAGMAARIVTAYRMTNGVVNAAVTNFTKQLSEQVGRDGITVNTIHPGYTWTPRLEGALNKWAELDGKPFEAILAERTAEIPIGRFIQAREIADLVVFLASAAAGAVTGQAIAVDGGSGRGVNY